MNKNVPKLRFKDDNGKDYPEWEEKGLGEITQLTDGVHFTPEYVQEGIPFWSVETIVSNAKPKFITKEAHQLAIRRCYPKKNDILITRIGTLAKSKVIDNDEELSIYVSVALIKSSKVFNSKYMKQYFDTEKYYKEFLSKSLLTATPKKINMEDLKNTVVMLPSLQEQEKIADFFTIIDRLIEEQEGKVRDLELYKKGMMQKIFKQEIRFKDDNGKDYPEWEEKKLLDIAEYITDFVAAGSFADIRKNVQYKDFKDYAQLIRTTDLKHNFKNNGFVYIDKNAFEYLYRVNLNEESIVLPNIGANIGEAYYIKPKKFEMKNNVLGPNAILLKSKINSNSFIFYLLSSRFFYSQLKQLVGASGQPKFNKTELKNMKFLLPVIEEQTKIANFLCNIDNILDEEKKKLDDLREMKKGLLQQMFV